MNRTRVFLTPAMWMVQASLMRQLRARYGEGLLVDPLKDAAPEQRAAIWQRISQAQAVIISAQSLVRHEDEVSWDGLEPLRLDRNDFLGPILALLHRQALRAKGEQGQAGPADLDLRLVMRMVGNAYTGRAVLDEVAPAAPEWWLDAADGPDGLSRTDDPDAEAALQLASNAEMLREQARREQIPPFKLATPIIAPRGPQLQVLCCGRDVADYLPRLAAHLHEQGLALAYLDHGSADGSAALARKLIGAGIGSVADLPWRGVFSLQEQLEAKAKMAAQSEARWVLHMDADEILMPRADETLTELSARADAAGYNAVHFDEFVFLPEPDQDLAGRDYVAEAQRYYFHAPAPFRLLRLWKQGVGLDNVAQGGHRLSGPLRLLPQAQDLRHYMVLSQKAALQKYLARVYDPKEIARDWHKNRLSLTEAALQLPPLGDPRLEHVGAERGLSRARAKSTHWWAWESSIGAPV